MPKQTAWNLSKIRDIARGLTQAAKRLGVTQPRQECTLRCGSAKPRYFTLTRTTIPSPS
jgi:hypothetical protein